MKLKVKYHSKDLPRLEQTERGDWIDLRVDDIVSYKAGRTGLELGLGEWEEEGKLSYRAGDIIKVSFGISVEMPEGYEGYVLPRSSTFKHTGLIQTNHFGIIDNAYKGDNDIWQGEYIALRSGVIKRHERIAQMRIQKSQPKLDIIEVDSLGNEDRGGYGTSGRE